ncbi:MAG: InlB B-repeat-containing protein [Bacteroidales bacterium]|jgi:hypothetical protein|nr:InlB B-repeat-containing protein [Bacteroidales bacterium]
MKTRKFSECLKTSLFVVFISGLFFASCKKVIPVDAVILSADTLVLAIGEKATLTVTVLPENADIMAVTWKKTYTDDVVSVNETTGEIIAMAIGKTSVYANVTVHLTEKSSGTMSKYCVVIVANLYNVTYDANGGSNAPDALLRIIEDTPLTVNDGKSITPPPGKFITGWNTARDGSGTFYKPHTTLNVTENITFYAMWPGDGSNRSNPLAITNANEFEKIRTGLDKHYILANDINIGSFWEPIGNFSGSLDGNEHVVTFDELHAENPTSQYFFGGLFGYVDQNSIIENLIVNGESMTVNSTKSIYIGAVAGSNSGTIRNCFSNIPISGTTTSSYVFLGGIAGYNEGTIQNCYSSGNLHAETTSSEEYGRCTAGGIAGYNEKIIQNCYYTGNIYAQNHYSKSAFTYDACAAGGIAGTNAYNGNILHCYATGDVETKAKEHTTAGGIIGYGRNLSNVHGCVALNSSITAFSADAESEAYPVIGLQIYANPQNYANSGMAVTGKNSVNRGVSGTRVSISATEAENGAWWRETADWKDSWGVSDNKPWQWDDTKKRPKLYWERNVEL